jgi:hypothetical protein
VNKEFDEIWSKEEQGGGRKVISQNTERNMQMIVEDGHTRHIPINPNKPCFPKKKGEGK